MKDIKYIVAIKDEYVKNFELTTIKKKFCASYIKSEYNNIYFELNGSKAFVIIPEKWIESMVPSRECNPLYKQNNEYLPLFYKDKVICYTNCSLEKLTELCIKTKEMIEREYND